MNISGKITKKHGIAALCFVLLVLMGYFTYNIIVNKQELSNSSIAMGTIISQKLTGAHREETAGKINEKIKSIENDNLSWRISGSEISKINSQAGKPVVVGSDTLRWVKSSLDVCKSCAGALDITVGRLTALWGIGTDNPRLPKQSEIDGLLSSVGYEKVTITGNAVTVAKGQRLDMGAVGKGIACDEALKILEASKIKFAIISVGGSVLLFGDSKDIHVGIRNPRGEANDFMGILTLRNCFVSTSGDYEKLFTVGNKHYHHILDPKTGYPSNSGLMSVTIVCQSGLLSDALSTACFVLGYEKSLPLLKKYNAQAVFIDTDYSVHVTGGLRDKFRITDTSHYKMKAD